MKKILSSSVICAVVAGCSNGPTNDDRATALSQQNLDVGALNGSDLTKKQGALASVQDEALREADTEQYYSRFIPPIANQGSIATLQQFIDLFQFTGRETVARYYNRGDLGIGREMHCVNNLATGFNAACYVKNFAAGDDGSEFTFGMSPDIAFTNMNNNHEFATVAMFFNSTFSQKVSFIVYNNKGNTLSVNGKNDLKLDTVSNFAALDRVGINFLTTGIGTPGVNFNNHIPSNCITCHGGQPYDTSNHTAIGSLFLPFDLDQFDFDSTHTRASQLDAFRALNQIVRDVAVRSGSDISGSLKNQLDGWYGNTSHSSSLGSLAGCAVTDTRPGCFNSDFVPPGWGSASAPAVYQSVVRGTCRNCHVVSDIAALHFDSALQFNALSSGLANDIVSFRMPHALQATRQFWLSPQPAALEAYFRGLGGTTNTNAANLIHSGGPGNVATLDPQHIVANLAFGN